MDVLPPIFIDRQEPLIKLYWETFVSFCALGPPPLTTWAASFYVRQTISALNNLIIRETPDQPMFRDDNKAIMVIQLLTMLTVMAVRVLFLLNPKMACPSSSRSYDFGGPRKEDRMVNADSCYDDSSCPAVMPSASLFALHGILILASFIWLMQIMPQLRFASIYETGCAVVLRGDFNLGVSEQTKNMMLKRSTFLSMPGWRISSSFREVFNGTIAAVTFWPQSLLPSSIAMLFITYQLIFLISTLLSVYTLALLPIHRAKVGRSQSITQRRATTPHKCPRRAIVTRQLAKVKSFTPFGAKFSRPRPPISFTWHMRLF